MRNIFLVLRRYSVLLLFLSLQALSITMLVSFNRSHQARYMEISYELTGRIEKRVSDFTQYFALAENNKKLAAENIRLANLLKEDFVVLDTSATEKTISNKVDSQLVTRKYLWREAKVYNNSVSGQNNFITLGRGSKQGIQKDMAVVNASGIVGVVVDVSENMSIVMSLLHRKSNTSVALKKTGTTGISEWDGKNPQRLQVKGIPKSAKLSKGDTLLTSNLSFNYPEGLMVGTITDFALDEGGNYYQINLKPGANFYTLEYVSVVENLFLKEQKELEERARRK